MAENQEDRNTDDLSDEASPYRLEEFRRKGQTAQSRELSAMVALLGAGAALYFAIPSMTQDLVQLLREYLRTDLFAKLDFQNETAVFDRLRAVFILTGKLILPIGLVGFIVAALSSYAQVGSIFTFEPLTPDFSKIDPIKGFRRYFSMKILLDGLRTIVRAAVVIGVAYLLIQIQVRSSPIWSLVDPGGISEGWSTQGRKIFLIMSFVLLFFAGFDLWIQKWEFGKQARLTRQEAKQEHKEHEGDPLIKARIRSVQREMARKRMMEAVKTADVVVTNPTHIAVAILYDRTQMDAPKVIAKGADLMAQKIKRLAADAGVPMVENVPLARSLFKHVKLNHAIPKTLYQAVAEVLAYVYRLKKRKFEVRP